MAQTKTGLRTVRLPDGLVDRLARNGWIVSTADSERRAAKMTGTPSVSELAALGLRIGLDAADAMERAR